MGKIIKEGFLPPDHPILSEPPTFYSPDSTKHFFESEESSASGTAGQTQEDSSRASGDESDPTSPTPPSTG